MCTPEVIDINVSQLARSRYFAEQMGEVVFAEYNDYLDAHGGEPPTKKVSVLVSIPVALNDMILEAVKLIGCSRTIRSLSR